MRNKKNKLAPKNELCAVCNGKIVNNICRNCGLTKEQIGKYLKSNDNDGSNDKAKIKDLLK